MFLINFEFKQKLKRIVLTLFIITIIIQIIFHKTALSSKKIIHLIISSGFGNVYINNY